MNFIFNVLFLCFYVEITYGARCDEDSRSIANDCGEKLFFVGRNSRLYPESGPHLDSFCRETTNLMSCVTDFTNACRQGLHRSMTNVMIATVRVNQRNYCSAKRQELLDMSKCGNAIRGQSANCMDLFLANLGRANVAVKRHRVPHGCCAFYELKACIIRAANRMPGHICNEQRLEHLERYINSMAGNTLNMMCGEYDEDSDKCKRLPPLPTGNIRPAPDIFSGFGKLIKP